MGAAADCELIRHGLLGQPVNTITTLAFVVAGIWVLARQRYPWVGMALIATGVGSFAFHGPMPVWSEWAHDVSLAWLIAVIGGLNTRWENWSRLPALAGMGVVFAVSPLAADPVAVALAIVVGVFIVIRRSSTREWMPLGLLAAVAILGRLGATGGPLCDPGSIWQLHGLWHVGAAVAVTWWTTLKSPDRRLSQP